MTRFARNIHQSRHARLHSKGHFILGNSSRNFRIVHSVVFESIQLFDRVDYILLSPGMAQEWVAKDTYILATPNWGVGSDHRPLVATFEAQEK